MRVRIIKEYKDLERGGAIEPIGTEFDTPEARAELLFKLGYVGKILEAKGETATPEQAQEIHAYIRSIIAEQHGKEVADEVSILYGGSVKPDNAKEIFAKPDIDGGLIGGAALKVEDFAKIIEAFN